MNPNKALFRARAVAHLADAEAALGRARTCLEQALCLEAADRAGSLGTTAHALAEELLEEAAERSLARRRPDVQDLVGVVLSESTDALAGKVRLHLDKCRTERPLPIVFLESARTVEGEPFDFDAVANQDLNADLLKAITALDAVRKLRRG